MGAARGTAGPGRDAGVPWAEAVMSAVAAVSWALIGAAGTAALTSEPGHGPERVGEGVRLADLAGAGHCVPDTVGAP
ncbi:hypothetical protein [Streptomyces sp. NPDC093991]|uniref:hypothetical protein n=1 Tax=unclassified Streptomyces TaxID=2593676 RepID=UPI0034382756